MRIVSMTSTLVFPISLAAFVLAWLLIKWLAPGTGARRREAARLERIAALSVEQAAIQAHALLSDPTVFRVVEIPATNTAALERLAPHQRSIFQRYETIELLRPPWLKLSRLSIGPSARIKELLSIGVIAEATDMAAEVAVRPGEEGIYELYSDEPSDASGVHKSLYHFLIAVAQEST